MAGDPQPDVGAPLLPGHADVVIVGAGFTGLWSAYYLLRAHPGLDVVVLEADHVGFGASGRNGGWVSALWPVSPDAIAARHGPAAAVAQQRALRDTVVEVGRVCDAEGIDAGFAQGGTLVLARGPAQTSRAQAAAAAGSSWGDGTIWLTRAAATARLAGQGIDGATFNPHCARVHPARLVHGLATAVRRRGGLIIEGARVREILPGRVHLAGGGSVSTRHVIRATEAWTATLAATHRRVAPVYSLMVATEPLSAPAWDAIGLADRETFSDHGHVIVYGQRTIDDRIAFGGRGAPYHLGSGIRPRFDVDAGVFARLRHTLIGLLPSLADVDFTHAWGGPLGIARDWHPSVGYDPSTGQGWAGGYVGDGVAAANLAGRTLTDLVLARESDLTQLPWVGHRSPTWEPEPLRWLGINAGLQLARAADLEERFTGRPARLGRVLSQLTGH
ncbi:MAG: NAD(P)/FAD-dependent oxidoreductase [Nostocoides sp.]